jgi:hypothetical protein
VRAPARPQGLGGRAGGGAAGGARGQRRRTRQDGRRSVLVVSQMALALVLFAGAALLFEPSSACGSSTPASLPRT